MLDKAGAVAAARWRLKALAGPAGSLRRHLLWALAGTFSLNFVQKVLMLGLTILLARYMGPHDYGVYASVYAAITMFCAPASQGLTSLLVREMAAGHVRGDWPSMRGLLARSVQLVLVVSLLSAAVLLLMAPHFSEGGGYTAAAIWLGFSMVPFRLLSSLRNAALRGLHQVTLGLLPEMLILPGFFMVGALLAHYIYVESLTPSMVIGLRLTATVVAFGVGAILLWWKMPRPIFSARSNYHTRAWLRASAPMMWVGGMTVITTQTDVLMLAVLKGSTEAGVYQVAARGAELVNLVSFIGTMALQPTLARLHSDGDLTRLKRVTQTAARFMFMAALVMYGIYMLLGREILRMVFGLKFEGALPALLILAFGWTAIAAMGPARDTLLMIGGERQLAIYMSVAAALNVVLNLLFVPTLGSTGAAIATAASFVVGSGAYTLAVWQRIGFRPSII